MLKLFDTKIKT